MINLSNLGPALLRGIFTSREGGVESRFTVGEILEGTVLKSLGREGALVRLRGINLAAATARPLSAGQSILVKVEQLSPQFIVSLLMNDSPVQEKTAAVLRLYLPAAAPMARLFPIWKR